jgi:hypothetical protein
LAGLAKAKSARCPRQMRAKQGRSLKSPVNIKSFPAESAVVYATKVATTGVFCGVELSGFAGLDCSVSFS